MDILLQLPPDVYKRAQQIAQDSNRPLEHVLVDTLALLFGDTPLLDVNELAQLDDTALWAIVRRRSSVWDRQRLQELQQQPVLSASEQDEQERLIHAYDRYVLVRSQALALLAERGHDIQSFLNERV